MNATTEPTGSLTRDERLADAREVLQRMRDPDGIYADDHARATITWLVEQVEHQPGHAHTHAAFARRFLAAAYGDHNPMPPEWVHVTKVSGEAGEMVEAYQRWLGFARRTGTRSEFEDELSDVVISAYIAAARVQVDLDASVAAKQHVIMHRGFSQALDQADGPA